MTSKYYILFSIMFPLTVYYFINGDNFNPKSVRAKRVLITGATSGIGKQVAYKYSAFRANVVITGRRTELLSTVAKRCKQLGAASVHIVAADMALVEDRVRLVTEAKSVLGGLDILILNHAVIHVGIWNVTLDNNLMHELNVNFLSHVDLASMLMSTLVQSGGNIGVVSSIFGRYGCLGLTSYVATKHALQGFFSSLRSELQWLKTNVKITLAVFDFINTERVSQIFDETAPILRFELMAGREEDAAEVLVRGIANNLYEIVFPYCYKWTVVLSNLFPHYFSDFNVWLYTTSVDY